MKFRRLLFLIPLYCLSGIPAYSQFKESPWVNVVRRKIPSTPSSFSMTNTFGWNAGDLDRSVGTDGKVMTDSERHEVVGVGMIIRPNGKMIIASSSYDDTILNPSISSSSLNLSISSLIVQYNHDGSLDTSFGSGGMIKINDGSIFYAQPSSLMALQNDGKIVAVTRSIMPTYSKIICFRFNEDGGPDYGFGSGGNFVTSAYDTIVPLSLKIQSDGKIVLAGMAPPSSFALERLNSDGSLDTTFGTDKSGRVITDFPNTVGSAAISLSIQDDGKMIAGGEEFSSSSGVIVLARYNVDGSLDTSFGGTGVVTNEPGQRFSSMVLQRDGKIIHTSIRVNDNKGINSDDVIVTRYNSDGISNSEIATKFTYDPRNNSFDSPSITLQGDKMILTANHILEPFHGLNLPKRRALSDDSTAFLDRFSNLIGFEKSLSLLERLNSDGTLDTSFGDQGKVFMDDEDITALAVQPDSDIVVAGHANNSIVLKRYHGATVKISNPHKGDTPAPDSIKQYDFKSDSGRYRQE